MIKSDVIQAFLAYNIVAIRQQLFLAEYTVLVLKLNCKQSFICYGSIF
jgi:hypothetical protein